MTNNEAIEQLKSILETGVADADVLLYTEDYEAIDYAINSLAQKPCDDCISREDALNKINALIAEYIPLMPVGWTLPLNIAKTINELPPVTPQPKTGQWIFDEILDKHYYCSECKSMGVDYWDFCPNCGAKMEVSE